MGADESVAKRNSSYFDHDADIGIVGRGESVEAAFEAAAAALFGLMADPTQIQLVEQIGFEFDEPDLELALVTWLNLLVGEARAEGLALGRFRLRRADGRWRGEAWGELWHDDLERGVEVKGATLTELAVRQNQAGWEARCVVDV